jgi:hypothetical protein
MQARVWWGRGSDTGEFPVAWPVPSASAVRFARCGLRARFRARGRWWPARVRAPATIVVRAGCRGVRGSRCVACGDCCDLVWVELRVDGKGRDRGWHPGVAYEAGQAGPVMATSQRVGPGEVEARIIGILLLAVAVGTPGRVVVPRVPMTTRRSAGRISRRCARRPGDGLTQRRSKLAIVS